MSRSFVTYTRTKHQQHWMVGFYDSLDDFFARVKRCSEKESELIIREFAIEEVELPDHPEPLPCPEGYRTMPNPDGNGITLACPHCRKIIDAQGLVSRSPQPSNVIDVHPYQRAVS